jgi:hypothetical protein
MGPGSGKKRWDEANNPAAAPVIGHGKIARIIVGAAILDHVPSAFIGIEFFLFR